MMGKMNRFDAIFEVKSSIGKLWDSLEHFDKKGTVDFKKCQLFIKQFYNLVRMHNNCVIFTFPSVVVNKISFSKG